MLVSFVCSLALLLEAENHVLPKYVHVGITEGTKTRFCQETTCGSALFHSQQSDTN